MEYLTPGDYLAWPECTKSNGVDCSKRHHHHPMVGNESSASSDKSDKADGDSSCCLRDRLAGNDGGQRIENLLQVPRHQTRYVTKYEHYQHPS